MSRSTQAVSLGMHSQALNESSTSCVTTNLSTSSRRNPEGNEQRHRTRGSNDVLQRIMQHSQRFTASIFACSLSLQLISCLRRTTVIPLTRSFRCAVFALVHDVDFAPASLNRLRSTLTCTCETFLVRHNRFFYHCAIECS